MPRRRFRPLPLRFFFYATIVIVLLTLAAVGTLRAWETTDAAITIDPSAQAIAIDAGILGTNLPAWINPARFADPELHQLTAGAGVTLIRMPGGSWSNGYDWLSCEVDYDDICAWASRPTDFVGYLQANKLAGMYTINQNGTAKEAAALVAFFNGTVDDDTEIGVDIRGRDWGTVREWATLRTQNGHPEPAYVKYWEIGNETYGGTAESGVDCADWGWEEVWTCDGTEYVVGIGSGADRKQGYLEFRDAMRIVDPTIMVGAVGVPVQSDWSNWGNEVIAAAGDVMDFYIIHEYGYFDPPDSNAQVPAEPHETWPQIMANIDTAFEQHADGRKVPIAVTEYNMFAVQELDNDQLMKRMVNALYLADTVGQMIANGVSWATQWNLINGQAFNGTDYGMIDADTFVRHPQYYAYTLWSHFGNEMLSVTNSLPAETTLSTYAGRIDENTLSLLAINKSDDLIASTIAIIGDSTIESGEADVVQAKSLDAQTILYNGNAEPAVDLADAPSTPLTDVGAQITYSFVPYSITLLRLNLVRNAGPTDVPTATSTMTPVDTPVEMSTATPTVTVTSTATPTGEPSETSSTPDPANKTFLPLINKADVEREDGTMNETGIGVSGSGLLPGVSLLAVIVAAAIVGLRRRNRQR